MGSHDPFGVERTYFAPPQRTTQRELIAFRRMFLADALAPALLEAFGDPAMVLSGTRQIVAANELLCRTLQIPDATRVVGMRPGELLRCVHAETAPSGCGTNRACEFCGALGVILEALESQGEAEGECRVRTYQFHEGGALDLVVSARFMRIHQVGLVLVATRDVSAQKRRQVLERAFFHDVLNVASGIRAVAELLSDETADPAEEAEYKRDLLRMAEQIGDEIAAQRQLLAAEQDTLELDVSVVSPREILESVRELYRFHSVARNKRLRLGAVAEIEFETDPALLRRVLGNLVKNALEASAEGGTVTLDADRAGDDVIFGVHNATVMPESVQLQVFQRSFTTKKGKGRGIGTHSAKLIGERCLGGEVSFVSREPDGTRFTVRLPLSPLADGSRVRGAPPSGPA